MRKPMKGAGFLAALLLAACVPVQTRYWDDAPAKLKAGDLVRVETTAGKLHLFRVNRVEQAAFYGTAKNQIEYRVPFKALKQIWVRRTDTEWEGTHDFFAPVCCFVPL